MASKTRINLLSPLLIVMLLWRLTVPVRTRRPPAMSTSRRSLLPRLVMVSVENQATSCHVDEPKIVSQGLSGDETERPRPARVLPTTTPVMLNSNSPERCDHTSEASPVMVIPSMKQDSYTHETEPAIPAGVPPLTTPTVLNSDSLNAAITYQKPQTALNTLTFLSIPP